MITPETPVVVETLPDSNGDTDVYFGVLVEYNALTRRAELRSVHKAESLSTDTKGVGGAASIGPQSGAGTQVSPEFPAATVNNVANVLECTNTAVAAWETAPWT